MRITSIEAHGLSSPIDPPREFDFLGGTRRILKRDLVLVVVETADGEVGYAPAGASSSAMREYFADATHDTFVDVLREAVAPALEGTEVDDVEDAHGPVDALDLPELVTSQAVSAIDVALYDIVGKRRGTPVCDLLSPDEASSRRLPLYASGGMYLPPEGYAEEAAGLAEAGFRGYKYRPARGPEADRRTVRHIREAVGDDVDIMVDAHTWWKIHSDAYDRETVRQLIADFAEYDVYWVEEPVAPDDYDGYRDLRATTDVPLAGGESEKSPEGLIDLAATGAVNFLQGDVRHHRGFTGCWEAVEYCLDNDVTYVPHNFGSNLGLIANAHLIAAAPGFDLLEYPAFETDTQPGMYPFPLAEDILDTPIEIDDGELVVPRGPGLGVDVNLDALEEYPTVEGPWTEFNYDEAP